MLRRIMIGTVIIMLGLVVLGRYVTDERAGDRRIPNPTGESGPAGLTFYYTQQLTWTPCPGGFCSTMKVPLTYDKPADKTVRVAVKLRPADDGPSNGKLVLNPGGPGGSGVDFVDIFANETSGEIRASYDIVGFDPRGVGRSEPLECLSDANFGAVLALDPSPDDALEAEALIDGLTSMGQACRTKSGLLAEHVSTEEVARDMDVLRALIGEERLDYFGASYGTQIGATYATLFPDAVGSMVLDGAVDPALDKADQVRAQTTSLDRALRAYAATVGDVDDVLAPIESLIASLDVEPMKTQVDRVLTQTDAVYGIAFALYDRETWPLLTTALDRASFGDGTAMLALADRYFKRTSDGNFRDSSGQALSVIRCLDFPGTASIEDLTSLSDELEEVSPVFGGALAWGSAECAGLPDESAYAQAPIESTTSAPILIIGTTRDPATPFAWAKALNKQLPSSSLVIRKGDGHTGYDRKNICVDEAVEQYLLDGTVPSAALTCLEP